MEAIDSSIIAQSDLVLIQRDFPFYQSWFEEVVSRASQQHKPIIYEIDDLLFELPADNPYKANFDRARPAMLQGLVESHVVTASTAALCGYLGAFNQNVYRLSNYLDDNLWPLTPRSTQAQVGPITIGYIGGPTHAADIASIAPVLVRLQQRYPGQVRLRFCGIAAPPSLARRSGVDEELLSLQDYSEYAAYMQTLSVDIRRPVVQPSV